MKTSTLLKSCLVLALLWLFILGPGLWARVRILRHVAGHHRTLAAPGAVILRRLYQRAMPHGPEAAA